MLNTERLCIGCMNDNGGEEVCSICGYNQANPNSEEYLQPRYWLNERYLIGRVLDSNGEGVTYLGWDNNSDSIVNIREYFPKGAVQRKPSGEVAIVPGNEFTFNEGILSFLELNKKLMTMAHLPSMMSVTDVFEHAGTAYSIIKAVQGITLKEFLIRNGGNLEWEQARSLFLPLITTVAELHEAGIIHRGISPDTILVGRDGKLRLKDFCIRSVRMSNSNMAIQLYPGFSAVEQYGYDIKYRDGKYTDVYGVAATMFRVLMGKNPTEVPERINNDNMQIPARFAESIPKYVLTALANALQIMPQDRVQDMDSFRIMLTPVSAATAVAPKVVAPKPQPVVQPTVSPVSAPAPVKAAPEKKSSSKKYAIISSVITAVILIIIIVALYFILDIGGGDDKKSSGSSSTPKTSSSVPSDNPSNNSSEADEIPKEILALVGQKYSDVVKDGKYKDYEIEISSKVYSEDKEQDVIISIDKVKDKENVFQVVVSMGPREIQMPNLGGKTYNEAVEELLKLGFKYDNIEKLNDYSTALPEGMVINVSPAAGTMVDLDSKIELRVSAVDTTSNEPTTLPAE